MRVSANDDDDGDDDDDDDNTLLSGIRPLANSTLIGVVSIPTALK